MTDKLKVHPRITRTTDNILTKIGKKPSEALEEYACWRATGKDVVMLEEKMLKKKEQELLEDRETIEKRLEKVQDELDSIKELKKAFNPLKSKEFEETVEIVRQMLKASKVQLESGKWGVEKTKMEDIGRVCRTREMPIEAVLAEIPHELLQYLDEYNFG